MENEYKSGDQVGAAAVVWVSNAGGWEGSDLSKGAVLTSPLSVVERAML